MSKSPLMVDWDGDGSALPDTPPVRTQATLVMRKGEVAEPLPAGIEECQAAMADLDDRIGIVSALLDRVERGERTFETEYEKRAYRSKITALKNSLINRLRLVRAQLRMLEAADRDARRAARDAEQERQEAEKTRRAQALAELEATRILAREARQRETDERRAADIARAETCRLAEKAARHEQIENKIAEVSAHPNTVLNDAAMAEVARRAREARIARNRELREHERPALDALRKPLRRLLQKILAEKGPEFLGPFWLNRLGELTDKAELCPPSIVPDGAPTCLQCCKHFTDSPGEALAPGRSICYACEAGVTWHPDTPAP